MLNLSKLGNQMRHAVFELHSDLNAYQWRRQEAVKTWQNALAREHELVEMLLNSHDLPWSMARPLEPLSTRQKLATEPDTPVILATDGSQISPSRHEISPCYLINIGKIRYLYGTGERPLQDSEPFLYYRQADLYTQFQRQMLSISEQQIGLERSLKEVEELAKLCTETRQLWPERPALALIDGSLWGIVPELASYPSALQAPAYARLNQALACIFRAGIPVCGYISQSRRSEVVNFLRLARCPFSQPACEQYCREGEESCAGLAPLPDRELWSQLLSTGERSPLFTSTTPAPEALRGHDLCFFYLHCGAEIARIEIPRWTADNPQWMCWVQALVYSQVQKGQGYPIALAEAHNQAVIKSADRSQFYALLSPKMINARLGLSLSYKEQKKRRGIV